RLSLRPRTNKARKRRIYAQAPGPGARGAAGLEQLRVAGEISKSCPEVVGTSCGPANSLAGSGSHEKCAKKLAGQTFVRRWGISNSSVRFGSRRRHLNVPLDRGRVAGIHDPPPCRSGSP